MHIIEGALVLLAIVTISVSVFLYRPDLSPFQPGTFAYNVIPTASMLAAWTTLLVAYAAFRTIANTSELEVQRTREARVTEIIKWAEEIGTSILTIGTPQDEKRIRTVITTESLAALYLESRGDIAEKLMPLRMRSIYIKEVSRTDAAVQKNVEDSIEHLRRKLRLSYRYLEHEEALKQKRGYIKAAINVARNEYNLYASIVDLMKLIGDVKSMV